MPFLPMRAYPYFDCDTQSCIRHVAYFFGRASRPGGQEGWIDFIPNYFSEVPVMIRRGLIPADVLMSMASPMDDYKEHLRRLAVHDNALFDALAAPSSSHRSSTARCTPGHAGSP